ncbi:MAG: alpha-L-fucosidase, partial [Bacteroidota bacterium]
MKRLFGLIIAFLIVNNSHGQQVFSETPREKEERMEWWTDARFGMFIHFGLYAMPAEHAWYKSKHKLN